MRWTIGNRLFIALVATSLIILGLSATLTRLSFQHGFLEYVTSQEVARLSDLAESLAAIYEQEGGWESLHDHPRLWSQLVRRGKEPADRGGPPPARERDPRPDPPPHRGGPPPPDPLDIASRIALVDKHGEIVAGHLAPGAGGQSLPIVLGNDTIGELRMAPPRRLTEEVDLRFARGRTRAIYSIAAIVLVVAALASWLIARQLTRPIRALAGGARAMTAGRFEERIEVGTRDELGDLAADFNALAAKLDASRQARRQWVADISHELRTPVSILGGELEAIEDGVRPFDDVTRKSLQAEVARLGKLIEDLRELTISDEGGLSYRRDEFDLTALLRDALETAAPRIRHAGLTLETDIAPPTALVMGDTTRLTQLITNLVENSLRYTEAPGSLRVRCTRETSAVTVVLEDTAPGVPHASLPHLFDRLYRVDESRNRLTGGSGLGLAICKAIVDAHDGEIAAGPSDLGGLRIEVTLPLVGVARL